MPHVVRVQVRRANHRAIRLWIPVLPVLVVLSPLLLLVMLTAVVACVVLRIDPIRALIATGRLLCAAKGTHLDVDQLQTRVLIDVR